MSTPYCSDCPDREFCGQGGPCGVAKKYVSHVASLTAPPSTVTIPLTWTRPPLSGNDRGHTRYNGFGQAKGAARFMVRAANVTPIVGAEVGLHWRVTDRRRRDPDNLAATLKACLDALVHEGVLPDDSWVHVPAVECRIHPPNGEPAAMWLELTNIHPFDEVTA